MQEEHRRVAGIAKRVVLQQSAIPQRDTLDRHAAQPTTKPAPRGDHTQNSTRTTPDLVDNREDAFCAVDAAQGQADIAAGEVRGLTKDEALALIKRAR